jgi:hypothetical protein
MATSSQSREVGVEQDTSQKVEMLAAYSPNRAQLPGAILLRDAPRLDLDLFAVGVRAVVPGRGFVGQLQVQRLRA